MRKKNSMSLAGRAFGKSWPIRAAKISIEIPPRKPSTFLYTQRRLAHNLSARMQYLSVSIVGTRLRMVSVTRTPFSEVTLRAFSMSSPPMCLRYRSSVTAEILRK